MNLKTAIEFFKQWKGFTEEALAILAPKCEATQTVKTRPWYHESAVGMIAHYTGGPNGLASTRWANENQSNTGSSWHCTILDHRIAAVEHLLDKYPLVKQYLSVTAFFIASLDESTWHGNWTNGLTWGTEHRNLGRLNRKGYRGKYKAKRVVEIRGQNWEAYTKGQILSSIFITRAVKLIAESKGVKFDPTWVLPHSAVWGPGTDKSDTGSAFPMYNYRGAIFSPVFVEEPQWLQGYADHSVVDIDEDFDEEMADLERDCSPPPKVEPTQDLLEEKSQSWRGHLPWVRWAMEQLGYHVVTPQTLIQLDKDTKEAVYIFQRATHAPGWVKRYGKALSVDGIPGTKQTIPAIMYALDRFAIEYMNPLK